MKDKNVLFQIKDLEKAILRKLRPEINVEEEISKSPPTPTQMQIVGYILDNIEKEVFQKDLENIFNLRRATISGVLQSMEKRELIERITDKKDTRVKKIILQEKAKAMFEQNKKHLDELEKIAIKGIEKEELKNFSKVLYKMKENIEKSTTI